ncbi:hypothetical protein PRIPAC_84702 [Pristionchus pacificus]|uniref:Uncharacterized protein n=1 Tax=Pristionchus pacificus TaxID=54126 RepID=A0A454XVB5_PRIPA|nr:hypothetical protein PRIPAC_84702 [Pristionchus pacificus]|eukprot:PDM67030.1 hypothetical protein PRIPAC_48447 [Pristionchus pacificus]
MRLLAVILSVLLSLALLAEARPSSLLQGRVFEDNGIAVDSVPKRQAPAASDYREKILMLETNKLPSLSKYFSMHEW